MPAASPGAIAGRSASGRCGCSAAFPTRRASDLLFSSGPLDPSASERDIPPVSGAERAIDRTDAREHVTFGGRLETGAKGRIARMILDQHRGGDFRDFARIDAWATGVARAIETPPEGP